MRLPIVWVVLLCAVAPKPTAAGPPLISDDPHTVGPGNVEAIMAVGAFGVRENVDLSAPIVDLTLGVLTGLDLIFVVNPIFEFGPEERLGSDAAFTFAAKWQPIRGEHWNAGVTPAVSFNFPTEKEITVFLPVHIEYQWSRFAVGTDTSFAAVSNGPDLWFAALYGTAALSDHFLLVSEIFGFRSPIDESSQLALSFGVDWHTPLGIHVLAAAGPGIASWDGVRLKWRTYLGLQWNFSLWKRH